MYFLVFVVGELELVIFFQLIIIVFEVWVLLFS